MKTIIAFLKQCIPQVVRDYIRDHRDYVIDVIRNVGKPVGEMRYLGYRLFYSHGMAIISRVRTEGIFEEKLCDALVTDLQKEAQPLFVDVGANIGLISLAILSRAPNTHVHAFEAGPHQAALLTKTIEANSLGSSIDLHEVALGNTHGKQEFFVHVARHAAKDGFKDTGRGQHGKTIVVDSITLDEWWEKAGKPTVSVIKIDTEGAEYFILQGGENCIRACKPSLFLEIEPRNLAAYALSPQTILSWLDTVGYTVSTLDGVPCTTENLEELLQTQDTFVGRSQNR